MMSFAHIKPQETVIIEGDDQSPVYVMIDTGTNRMTLTEKEYFDELDESVKREMQLAKKNLTLRVEGVGKIGRFEDVYYSPEADDNLCGASVICDLGYRCVFSKKKIVVVDAVKNNIVAIGFRNNGLYYLKLSDLLYLGNDDRANVLVSSETDPIQILHERFGHVAHSTIHEACRNRLFEGVDLPRHCYNKKFKCPSACHICNRVKVTRRTFRDERKQYATKAGDYISCDMGVFINCPSRDGYLYTLVYTDHASKYTW
jgi:hypothetical protein